MLAAYLHKDLVEAGCDEAGRGCLAGPVFAAAVILPKDYKNKELDDSKRLSLSQRLKLRQEIEQEAIAYAVAECSPGRIDKVNILNASFEAMGKAVRDLGTTPDMLLIDGNRFRTDLEIPYQCIIKGDEKYASIAAASILAKTYRDERMQNLAKDYPQYGWDKNKGYPTQAHRAAIRAHGSSPHHRKSFRLLPLGKQGELFKE